MFCDTLDSQLLKQRQRIRGEIQKVLDDKKNIKTGNKRSIFYELRDNAALPPAEKGLLRLEHEAVLIVMAGMSNSNWFSWAKVND